MSTHPPLDVATLRFLEQEVAARLHALDAYGVGAGCPSCHTAELRAFRARLARLRDEAEAQLRTTTATTK